MEAVLWLNKRVYFILTHPVYIHIFNLFHNYSVTKWLKDLKFGTVKY